MIDATGNPQRILLLGGTSDIALAVARRLASDRSGIEVVVAARPGQRRDAAVVELTSAGCLPSAVDLEATDPASRAAAVEEAFAGGDVDLVLVAFGVLGDPERAWQDVAHATELAEINYTAPVAIGVDVGARLRAQGHGTIVALSSVAGERPRRSNFVYGSTKAGMDAFYTGLGEALREHGVRVVVVRPGFVRSKMTTGLDPAPLSQTPQQVAEIVVGAVRSGREQVWAPSPMRWVMSILRHVPRVIFRRLPI